LSGYGIVSAQGGRECTHAVSDDENFVLELPRAEWGKLLDGTGGPSIRGKAVGGGYNQYNPSGDAFSRTYPGFQMDPT